MQGSPLSQTSFVSQEDRQDVFFRVNLHPPSLPPSGDSPTFPSQRHPHSRFAGATCLHLISIPASLPSYNLMVRANVFPDPIKWRLPPFFSARLFLGSSFSLAVERKAGVSFFQNLVSPPPRLSIVAGERAALFFFAWRATLPSLPHMRSFFFFRAAAPFSVLVFSRHPSESACVPRFVLFFSPPSGRAAPFSLCFAGTPFSRRDSFFPIAQGLPPLPQTGLISPLNPELSLVTPDSGAPT